MLYFLLLVYSCWQLITIGPCAVATLLDSELTQYQKLTELNRSYMMNLSEEKCEFLQKVFNLLDCNGDGILSMEVLFHHRHTRNQKHRSPVILTWFMWIFRLQDIETDAIREKIQSIQSMLVKLENAKKTKKSFTFQEFAIAISVKSAEEKLR